MTAVAPKPFNTLASPRCEPVDGRSAPNAGVVAAERDGRQRPFLCAAEGIPIRTVPRAALDELVARLIAAGAVERPRAGV